MQFSKELLGVQTIYRDNYRIFNQKCMDGDFKVNQWGLHQIVRVIDSHVILVKVVKKGKR